MKTKHFSYDIHELIKLVKDRPCLWDNSDLEKQNKLKKRECWNEIYCALEDNYNELDDDQQRLIAQSITAKWMNLRDAFVRSVKFGNTNYVHYKEMQFLMKNIKVRNPDCIWEFENTEENNSNLEFEQLECKPRKSKRKRKRASSEQSFDHTSALLETEMDPHQIEQGEFEEVDVDDENAAGEQDEDAAFFISLLPSVRSMSEDDKLEFRVDVLNLVRNIKKKYKTN